MQKTLSKILHAKEQRQSIKKQYAKQNCATVSINFNIPGYPKTNKLINKAFCFVKQELADYLKAIRLQIECDKIKNQCDEAGNICFFPFVQKNINLKNIKKHLEYFEQKHKLGRILDVDLFDKEQNVISSGKQKPCFICKSKPAIHCMRNKTHTYTELRNYTEKKIEKYYKQKTEQNICKKLSHTATWAILTEVSLLGKPGLVSPDDNGSHTDMNYHTFLSSTAAISTYFYKIAQLGYRWNGKQKQNIIIQLRELGLQMEHDMIVATKGINTQKGIVFLMGFCLFVAAYNLKNNANLNPNEFIDTLKTLNKNLVNSELAEGISENKSHGEQCFENFGKQLAGGIRKEVEEGLPTFFDNVYPFMKQISFCKNDNVNKQEFENKCMLILIKIMSVNNDTNILYRSDASTLNLLKEKSKKVLLDNNKLAQNIYYKELKQFCKEKNISPGGSADLFAISLFLYSLYAK